jgi:alkylhydroperoxidase family enzyme
MPWPRRRTERLRDTVRTWRQRLLAVEQWHEKADWRARAMSEGHVAASKRALAGLLACLTKRVKRRQVGSKCCVASWSKQEPASTPDMTVEYVCRARASAARPIPSEPHWLVPT